MDRSPRPGGVDVVVRAACNLVEGRREWALDYALCRLGARPWTTAFLRVNATCRTGGRTTATCAVAGLGTGRVDWRRARALLAAVAEARVLPVHLADVVTDAVVDWPASADDVIDIPAD